MLEKDLSLKKNLKANEDTALLIFTNLPYLTFNNADIAETEELTKSALIMLDRTFFFNQKIPNLKYLLGLGKMEQLKEYIDANPQINLVIINNKLTAAQGKNIEQFLNTRVIDRIELILHIFAQRAVSYEGKLQVELAQLENLRTRLVGGWTHLERQKGGIGLRGPGEKQLETDRRLLDKRIQKIKEALQQVKQQKNIAQNRIKKNQIFTVALVGYTNAGKSTLFNQLTQGQILVANMPFATLDTTGKKLTLNTRVQVVLYDTVGFIKDLPHKLVEAFASTLNHAKQADIILHIISSSDENMLENIVIVNQTLKQIQAEKVPVIEVQNKIDELEIPIEPKIEYDANQKAKKVYISALNHEHTDLIKQAIESYFEDKVKLCRFYLDYSQNNPRSFLYSYSKIVQEKADDQGIEIIAQIENKVLNKFSKQFNLAYDLI